MQGKLTTDCDGSVEHGKWQEPAGTLSMAHTMYSIHIWSVDLFSVKDKAPGRKLIKMAALWFGCVPKYSCLGLLTFKYNGVMCEVQITQVPWNYFLVIWGGCAMWVVLEKVTEVKATEGRVNQKYVYSSFMVKIRIIWGSFGLFWFNLGWGQCVRKEFVKFAFLGSWGQKVQI